MTRSVSFLGPDHSGAFDSLASSLARSLARVDGRAGLVVLADTAYLSEAIATATECVLVLDPGLTDVRALRDASGDIPIVLSESVAGIPAVLESRDAVRSVAADATFVDISAVTSRDDVWEALLQQVRLLTALDSDRQLDLRPALVGDRTVSSLGSWGAADLSLFAVHSEHEQPLVTATVHSPGQMARIAVSTSTMTRPGEVTLESLDGQVTRPAIYSSGHRSLIQQLDRKPEPSTHAATLERFLQDAATVLAAQGKA